ncbi:MAG: hypothetical protein ABTQ25_16350 [Nitrosomonas ureae]
MSTGNSRFSEFDKSDVFPSTGTEDPLPVSSFTRISMISHRLPAYPVRII